MAWLAAACLSGSLIREVIEHLRPLQRVPIVLRKLLLPARKWDPPSLAYYFWQCLPWEGTFAGLMGPWPLCTAFCVARCHHFYTEWEEGGIMTKVNSGCPASAMNKLRELSRDYTVRGFCKVKTRLLEQFFLHILLFEKCIKWPQNILKNLQGDGEP